MLPWIGSARSDKPTWNKRSRTITDRRASFNAVANALYLRNVKSHRLAALSKMLGCNQSTKTILKHLRDAGIVNPRKEMVGKWKKRRGGNLGGLSNGGGTDLQGRSLGNMFKVRLHWKNRGTNVPLLKVALAFNAWISFANSGGHFDLEAVLDGEKPP